MKTLAMSPEIAIFRRFSSNLRYSTKWLHTHRFVTVFSWCIGKPYGREKSFPYHYCFCFGGNILGHEEGFIHEPG